MNTIIEQIEAVVSAHPKATKPELWATQTAIATRRRGKEMCIATIRFDDQCNNGHNSFTITGEHRDGSHHTAGVGAVFTRLFRTSSQSLFHLSNGTT